MNILKLISFIKPIGVDPDAQAFIDAVGLSDSTQKSAINNLVKDLKNYGLWTKIKAAYPFVGGTATTHKYNLKDPRDLDGSFRLNFITVGGPWTHNSDGIENVGDTAYPNYNRILANTFVKGSDIAYNDFHMTYYSKTSNTNFTGSMEIGIGSWFDSKYCGISIKYGRGWAPNYFITGVNNSTSGLGLYCLSMLPTDLKLYQNGNKISEVVGTPSSNNWQPTVPIHIGGMVPYDVGWTANAKEPSARKCAFVSIGSGLTSIEQSNLYTAVQAYETTLGRQV